jgi:uncharacterized membrane protein (DUF106 family)
MKIKTKIIENLALIGFLIMGIAALTLLVFIFVLGMDADLFYYILWGVVTSFIIGFMMVFISSEMMEKKKNEAQKEAERLKDKYIENLEQKVDQQNVIIEFLLND